jgi:glycosyltransferase involved in cell wall biosynthesis
MHLIKEHESDSIEVEKVGFGRIIWIPVTIRQSSSRLVDLPGRLGFMLGRYLHRSQDEAKVKPIQIMPKAWRLSRSWGAHLRFQAAVFSDHLRHMLEEQNVDLLVLHWMSYDADPIITQALKSKIPFVFINHFDNERLSRLATRKWLDRAAAIGVVSALNIPEGLRGRCFNLSDAVDTDFFNPDKARIRRITADPIVLLPARIVNHKGHKDLIETARILISRKINLALIFIGAVDSEPLQQELRKLAATAGIEERVLFMGEKSAEEIRDCYAMSSIVALPSYSEGLPRVLLEAQSMEKPFVAYDSGGMREAVLPGETGFLVPTGDVNALADKLAFLLQNESERRRMGQRGREFVSQKFSISSLIKRHEAFYLKALSRRNSC